MSFCVNLLRRLKKAGPAAFSLCLAALLVLISAAFLDNDEKSWVDETLNNLSLRDRIAQLVMIRVPGKFINLESPEFLEIEQEIRQNRVGGVVLFAGNVYESAVLLNRLQTLSELPLLVAADFERGASFRIADTTSFTWAMALGATGSEEFAYEQGVVTAQESRALGVHWIFAPVVDVNNNPENPVINIRSFGEDPLLVSRLGAAFIRGAKSGGVLTTAKHFPGHGDTATDSHLDLAVVESDMSRLQSLEFAPFRSAIDAGVDAIMTAHVAVPRVTGESEVPATLSSTILTDILRNTLNFHGIIVTDALEMAGVTSRYWCGQAAVRAIQAGADVLLLPTNARVAINEVERAVKRGDISEIRIDQSVRKILEAKSALGLQQSRAVSIDRIGETIASPRHTDLAQEIADHSITVAKDEQHLIPVNPLTEKRIFSLVLSPGLDSSPASFFQEEMRRRFTSVRTAWVNARVSSDLLSEINRAVARSDLIVCATSVGLRSREAAVSLPGNQQRIIKTLLASRKPLIWVALGNPYVLPLAPKIGTYICTFSGSDVSQVAAAKAIAGAIAITGRMPISVPPYLKMGDGLQVPRLEMTLKPLSSDESSPSDDTFGKTSRLLQGFIDSGVFPSAQILAGRKSRIVLDRSFGAAGVSAGSSAPSPDATYDIASISRLVGITSAAMLAYESHSLILATPVRDYVPELRDTDIGGLQIQDLLKAFSGSSPLDPISAGAREDALKEILCRATGISVDRLLSTGLYGPLRMSHTFFDKPEDAKVEKAITGSPESSLPLSSAGDLAIFAQMMLNRGMYDHQRYFKPGTIAKFTGSWGPWSRPENFNWSRRMFPPSAYGHLASTGSFIWIDPVRDSFIIFLANGSPGNKAFPEAQRQIIESILSRP